MLNKIFFVICITLVIITKITIICLAKTNTATQTDKQKKITYKGDVLDDTDIVVLSFKSEAQDFAKYGFSIFYNCMFEGDITFTGIQNSDKDKYEILAIPYSGFTVGKLGSRPKYNSFELRNLTENKYKNLWVFLNTHTGSFHYSYSANYMKIHFDSLLNELFVESKILENEELTEFHITDINSDGSLVLYHSGIVQYVVNDTSGYFFLKNDKTIDEIVKGAFDNQIYCISNAKFLNDDEVFLTGLGLYGKVLMVYSKIDSNRTRYIFSGESELVTNWRNENTSPLAISAKGDKVAFQAIYFDENDDKRKKKPLWLSVWDLKNDRVDKIYKLEDNYQGNENYTKRDSIFEFNPISQSNLIAISHIDSGLWKKSTFYRFHPHMNNIKIIDIKRKKLVKDFPGISPKSMRWSPDGKKLGFLKEGEYGFNEGVRYSLPPSLWIYDLEKDTLEMIDEDHGHFDFFWINRYDPKTKFFVNIEEAKYYIVVSIFVLILVATLLPQKRRRK